MDSIGSSKSVLAFRIIQRSIYIGKITWLEEFLKYLQNLLQTPHYVT